MPPAKRRELMVAMSRANSELTRVSESERSSTCSAVAERSGGSSAAGAERGWNISGDFNV